MRPRAPAMRKAGPCLGCGGDHWLRDCPDKMILGYKGERLPPIERYCVGCSVDHLPKMCPHRPTLAAPTVLNPNPNVRPNQALNYIEVIPSPFAEEEEKDRASLRVNTRAREMGRSKKAKSRDSETKDKQSRKRSPKRRGRPKKEKKSRVGAEPEKDQQKPLEPKPKDQGKEKDQVANSSSSSHKGGSVLTDKINEPIEAALRAYGDRLAAQEGLLDKLKLYPNYREEKAQMMAGRNLIAETQTMMEGPLPILPKGPIKLSPKLETILEVSSQK